MYMNINLAWELWKDVHIKFLDKLKELAFPAAFSVIMSIWAVASFVFYNLLRKIE